jgi:hypothetical protein
MAETLHYVFGDAKFSLQQLVRQGNEEYPPVKAKGFGKYFMI